MSLATTALSAPGVPRLQAVPDRAMLMTAALGRADLVRFALVNGAAVGARETARNETPRWCLPPAMFTPVVESLLERGAEVNEPTRAVWTGSMHAAHEELQPVLDLGLGAGADTEQREVRQVSTALILAAGRRDEDAVRARSGHVADVTAAGDEGGAHSRRCAGRRQRLIGISVRGCGAAAA